MIHREGRLGFINWSQKGSSDVLLWWVYLKRLSFYQCYDVSDKYAFVAICASNLLTNIL